MTGHLKFDVRMVDDEHVQIEADVDLHKVTALDKVSLLNTFQKALNMNDNDVIRALALKATALKNQDSTTIQIDKTKL